MSSMKKNVTVSEPTTLTINLSACKTVGDFACAATKSAPHLVDLQDSFSNVLQGVDEREIPLNRSRFKPQILLPNLRTLNLHIDMRAKTRCDIKVRRPGLKGMSGKGTNMVFILRWTDTGIVLKRAIEAQTGVPKDEQILEFEGDLVHD